MTETSPGKRHTGYWWAASTLIVVLLAAWGIRAATHSPVQVRVSTVERGDLVATTSTNGVIEPIQAFEAHAPLATTVKATYAKEGDQVAKGKLLLQLDDASAVAEMARAQAALKGAQADLSAVKHGGTQEEQITLNSQTTNAQEARDQAAQQLASMRGLAAAGAASPAEVTAAQAKLDAADVQLKLDQQKKTQRYSSLDMQHTSATLGDAQAAYAAAAQTVAESNVRAPFAGTVYSMPIHATDFVQIGEKLLEMADLNKLQVRAYFDEPEIGTLAVGLPVSIVWAAKPDRTWHGRIARMPSTVVHYGTRNVGEVLISVDDSDGVLLPATNVTVTVTKFSLPNVMLVPREALRSDNKGSYLFLLRDGKLERRAVTMGAINMVSAQITSGVNPGATVVLGSTQGQPLINGLAVQPVQ
jgi:HlyD family secretion protein